MEHGLPHVRLADDFIQNVKQNLLELIEIFFCNANLEGIGFSHRRSGEFHGMLRLAASPKIFHRQIKNPRKLFCFSEQGSRIKISPVRPDQSMNFRINLNLVE